MPHPYLYFSANDINIYQQKIQNDEKASERYRKATEKAEELLATDFLTEDYANGRDSLHGNFWSLGGQTNQMAGCLGLKYLIEGDERCFEKGKALIRHYTSFERWYAESYTKRTPIPWHSDLCSTGMTLAICTLYDMIHEGLTKQEQEEFAQKIYDLGVYPALSDWALPQTRIHAVDSMGHNWWAVCIAEVATGLLALQEHLPRETVDFTFACVNNALAAFITYPGNKLFNKFPNFDDRGLFYESIGYFEYGVGTLLRYLWCYERYFGENKVLRRAIPKNMGDALMGFCYPYTENGKTAYAYLNYGDSDFYGNRSFLAKQLVKLGLDTSAVRSAVNLSEPDMYEEIGGFSTSYPDASLDSLPKTMEYSSGYLVSRDSYAPNSSLFSVKSGFCWNHSHNDAGSFILLYNGKPVIEDNGRCDYDHKLYHAYYCQKEAHNVLTVGSKGSRVEELYRGTKFPGGLIDRKVGKDYLFVQADCTGPVAHLCSRMYRNFFWLNHRQLVIFDDVYSHTEDTVDFNLHYVGDLTVDGNVYHIKDGDTEARLICHYPTKTVYTKKIGHLDHKPDEEKEYLSVSTTVPDRKTLMIHTIEVMPQENAVSFSPLKAQNSDGICMEDENTAWEFWYNHMADGHIMHDNSNAIMAGYDTDAYMLVIIRDKKQNTKRLLAVCASYVRTESRVLFSSYAKETVEVTDLSEHKE